MSDPTELEIAWAQFRLKQINGLHNLQVGYVDRRDYAKAMRILKRANPQGSCVCGFRRANPDASYCPGCEASG